MPSIDISRFLCPIGECLYYALDKINRNGKSRIFVTNSKMQYVTTLTEGDIRQAILSKLPLEGGVDEIIKITQGSTRNDIPDSATVGTPEEDLKKLVNINQPLIPLLDKNNRVVDIFEREENFHAAVASPNLSGNEMPYLMECIESNWISSQGRFVTEFENMLAEYTDVQYAISTSSGTTALHLALEALSIGVGDEVIVPDLTFAATINAVFHAGATPVIVDVEPDSWCIDPESISAAITEKSKAIIPVHLYGQPAKMEAIRAIADKHNLKIIEDCAEAIGASLNNKRCGSLGDIACFSFFGNKIITTGEGGMCVTNDKALDDRVRLLRDHGMDTKKRYWHEEIGYNYRLTNIQAAIGVAQMERIENTLQLRSDIQSRYDEALLKTEKLKKVSPSPEAQSVTWLVAYLLDPSIDRDEFIKNAAKEGVDVRPFFYPLSDMPPYKNLSLNETPVSHDLSARGINLPTSLTYTEEDYQRIINTILKLLN